MNTTFHIQRAASPALTSAGLLAAFGLASCCALPFYLAGLGVGAAWLGDIGVYADFHRPVFLGVALAGLIGGGLVLLWQRRNMRLLAFWTTAVGWVVGAALLYLGLLYV